jgi:DNA-binding winged helix-turn-helix (wHTH) protein/TolB-like protein/Tfp pilus assembly protein PilF
MAKTTNPRYDFDAFRLDPTERLLLRDGQPVALTPKAFDTLLYFVENNNRLLSKEELLAKIWPDSFVEESNLAQHVSVLRKALGEKAGGGQYIETVPKRGYRFLGEVKTVWEEPQRVATGESAFLKLASQPFLVEKDRAQVELSVNENLEFGGNGFDRAPTAQAADFATDPLPAAPRAQRRGRRLVLAGLAVALLLLLGFFIFRSLRQAPSAPAKPRLAVLPFRNLKPATDSDFLGFSLADAVITKLSYVSSLTVRPSAYVEKYRNQQLDPRQLARELSVDKLLTGTYLKEDDKLAINLQLIDLPTNQTLWTESLNLPAARLITLQERLSKEVLERLAVRLTPAESEQLAGGAPQNPLAYEYHLRGMDLYWQNDLPTASRMLAKSVELDPGYALSWAYLGTVHTTYASLYFGGRAYYDKAQEAYDRALALAPAQIEARTFRAALLIDTGRVEEAVPLLRGVLQTNPYLAQAHWELAYAYRFGGMLKESIAAGERSRQIDNEIRANNSVLNSYLYDGQYEQFLRSLPALENSAFVTFYRGFGHYYLKDAKQAASHFDRAYELNPSLMPAQAGKALSLALAGQAAQGLALLARTEKQLDESGVADAEGIYKIAQAYAVLGDQAAALRLLRRSIEGGFFCYPYFVNDPLLDNLRATGEFTQLLATAKERHERFKRAFF